MWINELTANTKSVESTMGSQRSSKWTMSQTFLVCLYYTDRGLQVNHNSLAVVLDHSGLRTAARGFHGEDPRVRRPTLPPLIGLDGEPAIRVVPAHVDPHRLRIGTVTVAEALAIIIVQREGAVRARMNSERRRLGHGLCGELAHGIQRHDGSGPRVEGHRREIHR